MRFLDTLASYLPSLIVHHLVENDEPTSKAPTRQSYDTVCLFCDVSGFTALAEKMEEQGEGAEGLATKLNSYFSMMCRVITADGGDVFKFAGDACIVLWPDTDDMTTRLLRAVQCAYAIQELMHDSYMGNMENVKMERGDKSDVQLSVKCGIGMGNVSVLHIGGILGRMEYLAVGEPLLQAFQAEHHANPGDIIVSEECWKLLEGSVEQQEIFSDKYVKLINHTKAKHDKLVRKKNMAQMHKDDMDDVRIEAKIKQYITGAVLPNLNPDCPDDEKWGNELRKVCVLFVNLGIKEQQLLAAARYEEAMRDVHDVLCEVQKSVYQYEGAINKFLMDDKGSTLIACFGLPPGAHEDDCERGVLAALRVCERLYDRGLSASCGLTFGEVFCGIIGNRVRREYSVLGDCVNLSARLMQRATSEGGGVLCDSAVVETCGASLLFTELDSIKVKGKDRAVKIYSPYPQDRQRYPLPAPAHHGGPNFYKGIYGAQKEYYTARRTLTFLQVYLRHISNREKTLKADKCKGKNGHRNVSDVVYGTTSSKSGIYRDGSDVVIGSSNLGSTSFGYGSEEQDMKGVRKSFMAPSGGKSRRNSVLTMKKGLLDDAKSSPEVKHRQPRICRPTLTPSGLIPIHHALSSGGFGTERLSSVGEGIDRPSINSDFTADNDAGSPELVSNGSKAYEYQVIVTVPVRLRIDNLRMNSPTLPPINLNDVGDFRQLEHKVVRMAIQYGFMTQHDGKDRVVLNVMGTRCFLPEENFDIKYLPAFVACFFDTDLSEDDIDMMLRGSDLMGRNQRESSISMNFAGSSVASSPMAVSGIGQKVNRKTYELTLIKEMEKLNVQNRLGVVRSKLLEKKIKLVDEGKGGVMVLEGEPGSGKTELLASFVARTLPNTAAIYVTHGAPFCGHVKPFGVWGVIIQQYIDLVMTSRAREDSAMSQRLDEGEEAKVALRTEILMQELRESFAEDGGDRHRWLLGYAYLLNDLINIKASTRDDSESHVHPDPKKEKLILQAILFRLIKRLAAFKSSIIIFDDAMHLSHDSWSLAVAVTNLITSSLSSEGEAVRLLLIFGLRPMANYRSRYEMMSVDYEKLVDADQVSFLKLGGMPPEDVEEFVCKKLGPNVEEISETLFRLLEERAIGNPFIASELVSALESARGALKYERISTEKKEEEPAPAPDTSRRASIFASSRVRSMSGSPSSSELEGNMALAKIVKNDDFYIKVDLAEDFDHEKVPLLGKVMALQGARLDRLNACQQGILKVASIIAKYYQVKDPKQNDGLTFKWSALNEVYPVAGHKDHLWKELESLDDNGVLMQTKKERNELTQLDDYSFRFSFEAMCDCVMSRMLKEHRSQIRDSVDKYEAMCEKQRRQAHMSKVTQARTLLPADGEGTPFHQGKLNIQRRATSNFFTARGLKRKVQAGGEWKERFCVLRPDGMYMYKEATASGAAEHTQIIYLKDAKAEIEKKPEVVFDKNFVFSIEAKSWEKNNKKTETPRTFVLSSESKSEMDSWIYMVRYVIESIEAERAKTLVTSKANMSRRSLTKELSRKLNFKGPSQPMGLSSRASDDPETLDGEGDMRLVVTVKEGTQLINPEAFGTSNPYCILTLEDQHSRSRTPKSSSINPVWNETFVFPLELHQWVQSGLKIQILNRDVYLSDDFLGYCDIDLAALEPEDLPTYETARRGSIGSSTTVTTDEEVVGITSDRDKELKGKNLTLKLIPKKSYQIARGAVTVHVYLLMPKATREKCDAAGGWEKFKRQLQTEVLDSSFKGQMDLQLHQKKMAQNRETTERRELSSISLEDLLELTDEGLDCRDGEEDDKSKAQQPVPTPSAADRKGTESKPKPTQRSSVVNLEAAKKRISQVKADGEKPYMETAKEVEVKKEEYSKNTLNKMTERGNPLYRHASSMPSEGDDAQRAGFEEMASVIHKTQQGLKGLLNKVRASDTLHNKDSSTGLSTQVETDIKDILADVEAVDKKRSVSTKKHWSKLRSLAVIVGARDGHTAELDESDKKWLTANYTRDSVEEESSPKLSRSSSADERFSPGWKSRSGSRALRTKSAHRSSSPLDTEAFLRAMVSELEDGDDGGINAAFHYKDHKGAIQGPFKARDLFHWFNAGYIHEQVLVCVGDSPRTNSNPRGAPFVPFSIFLDTIKGNYVPVGGVEEVRSWNFDPDPFKDPNDETKQHWNWKFDITQYSEDELLGLGMSIIESLNAPNVFNVSEESFRNFTGHVRYYMTRNKLPYHNYYHALDVMQTCFVFVESLEASAYVTELESFGLVIAALCHDLDHPGLTNQYQVNRQTPLALRFNDASVLENMHASTCFQILRKTGCNIFSGLEKSDMAAIRKVIIGCIINTDMTYHFVLKTDLQDTINKTKEEGGILSFMRGDKDRDVLLKTLLHVADISNPCKKFELSKRWSDAVIKEFFFQGDLEKKEGLNVSMGCDRLTTAQETLSLNFCDFIVAPFFFSLYGLFPKLLPVIDCMVANRAEWHRRAVIYIKEKVFEGDTPDVLRAAELEKWDKRVTVFKESHANAVADGDEVERES